MIVSRVQARVLAVIVSIGIIVAPTSTFANGAMITHDPQSFAQSYAQFVESIEKYNNMIKTAQDTLDTMNRINDVMNTANNTLNNLQTGLADPRQLYDRFKSNVENIKANYERIAKSLENRNWSEIMFKKEFATCKKKWQNLMKQVREYEEQKAKDNLDLAERGDDGSDSAGKFLEDAQQKYADMQETKEIQAELKMIEDAYNGGLSKGTKEINAVFDQMQYQVDIFNIEAKARKHKNPYESQRDICNKVKEKEREQKIREAKEGYWEAVAKGNHIEARKKFIEWKKEENGKIKDRQEITKQIIESNKGYFNPNDKPAVLYINQDSGELKPATCDAKLICWKSLTGKDNKNDIAELLQIPQTDSNGNTTNIQKWVAKQSTIQDLFKNNHFNEALNLQNQRNMVLALQGDTQAIQKSQLETFTMLGMQIKDLNNTVKAIGKIAEHFLKMEYDIQEDNHSNKDNGDEETNENKISQTIKENTQNNWGNFEDLFESDSQTGRVSFKYKNKDNSGILGN